MEGQQVKSSWILRNITYINHKRISSVVLINLMLAFVSLGKDMLLAWYLGTTAQADAFLLAYFIIDTIGNNLLANALGVSIIPTLAGLQGRGQRYRFIKTTRYLVIYTLVFSLILACFIFGFRYSLISWMGIGLNTSSRTLSLALFTTLIPTLVLYPLVNIGVSVLQVHNQFNIPALAPVFFNLVLLVGLVYLQYFNIPLNQGVYDLALFVLAGVFIMLVLVWTPIIKHRLIRFSMESSAFNTRLTNNSPLGLIDLGKRFLFYLVTILFPQITYLFERYFASNQGTGTISALNFAFRLVQFPIWVFISALSSVLFPALAKVSVKHKRGEFNKLFINSLYFTSVLTIPFSIILFVLRVPIISILLQRGEFSAHSVDITANIMSGYVLTIVWQGFSVILVRAILVEGKLISALLAAAISAITTIGVDFLLVPYLGSTALGYGALVGAIINFITIYAFFYRYTQLQTTRLWKGLIILLLCNLPLLGVTLIFLRLWVLIIRIGGLGPKIGYTVLVSFICSLVYFMTLKRSKISITKLEI